MNTNLLDFVLECLHARRIPWTVVSRETGVPYETLKKIAHGTTPNPGVRHVQRLADYYVAKQSDIGAPSDAVPAGDKQTEEGVHA